MPRVSKDEISQEVVELAGDYDASWWGGTTKTSQVGYYTILEVRTDRDHLAVEVLGPNLDTAMQLCEAHYRALDE